MGGGTFLSQKWRVIMGSVPTSSVWTTEELLWLGGHLDQSVKKNNGKADRVGIVRDFNATFPGRDFNANKLAGIYTRNGGNQAKFIAWCRRERQKCGKMSSQERKDALILAVPPTSPPRVQKPPQKKAVLLRPQVAPPKSLPPPVSSKSIRRETAPAFEPLRLDASHDAIIATSIASWNPYDPMMKQGPWVRAAIAVNSECTIHKRYTDADTVEARVGREIVRFLTTHSIDHERAVAVSTGIRGYKPKPS